MEDQTPKTMQFGIQFSLFAPKFAEQITSQNLKFKEETVKEFQEQYEALMILRFSDLLTDKIFNTIQAKLYKKIVAHVKKINKLIYSKQA